MGKRAAPQAAATWEPIESLHRWDRNPRLNADAVEPVARSIEAYGFGAPILARTTDRRLIAGDTRYQAVQHLIAKHGPGYVIRGAPGPGLVPVRLMDLNDVESDALALIDNRAGEIATWDDDALMSILKDLGNEGAVMTEWWSQDELAALEASASPQPEGPASPTIADRFIIPPFSVLDARSGAWRDRRSMWIALGIRSEMGRDSDLLAFDHLKFGAKYGADGRKENTTFGAGLDAYTSGASGSTGTSIFDPVVCELVYRWFGATGFSVLDPFAGGSVRGVVASALGLHYTGIDLRKEQIDANLIQWAATRSRILGTEPCWICGDSKELDKIVSKDDRFDLIFSCPPYGHLEVYSDNIDDISTMGVEEFRLAYRTIISKAVSVLREDRFAVFVVGDYREKRGFMCNFVSETIAAFESAGATLYNECILVTAIGSLPIRITKQFRSGRKIGKTHQNILVFYKGDPSKIRATYGDVEVTIPEAGADG